MNKTTIEWCDYTVNPVKGYCPMACEYCYARRLYDRFHWDKTIRLDMSVFDGMPTKPARIFVGSTIELFGKWVPPDWMEKILRVVRANPQHTFILLTKQPQNLTKWTWPDNAWVGVSVCNNKMLDAAADKLEDIQATVKFISFEPLLEHLTLSLDYVLYYSDVSWIIIGAETGNRKGKPPLSEVHKWAGEIIEAADSAGVPIFLKDNLKYTIKRQEMPI